MSDDTINETRDSAPAVAPAVSAPAGHWQAEPVDETFGAQGWSASSARDFWVTLRELVWPTARGAAQAAKWEKTLFALTLVTLCVMLIPVQPGVATYLQAAAQARADFRYDEALVEYAQAHAADATDPRPLCSAGDVYLLQKLPHQAAASYRACATLAPSDGSAWLRLGDALAAAGDDAGSNSMWRRAAAAGDDAGYARLAERAEGMGALDEAARWWSRMPHDDGVAQGHLGLLALARGNVTAASADFATLRLSSASSYATRLRDAGVFALAAHIPTRALDDENIGVALLTLGEPAVALEPLQRATQLAPKDGAAHAYYGWTLWLLGDPAAARPQIADGLRYSPILPFALYAAGQVAMTDGKFGLALAHFQTALQITPKNPALWSAAGDAALAEADYLTAELSYGNAAQYSNDPAYTVALIHFYVDHGIGLDNGQAAQLAFQGVRRFPTYEPLVLLEGQIDDRIGQQDEATYAFQQARALDPTDPGPWLYLGQYAVASGDVAPAVVYLRTALALRPSGPYAAQARQALAQVVGGATL